MGTLIVILIGIYAGVSEAAESTAIATIAAAGIGALAAWATSRSAARAAVESQSLASKTDIEKEAYKRAQSFYTDVIDRQERENRDLRAEVVALDGRVDTLEDQIDAERRERERVEKALREELDVAKKALRLAYPDDQ